MASVGFYEGFHVVPGNGKVAADDQGLSRQGGRHLLRRGFHAEAEAGGLQGFQFPAVVRVLEEGEDAVGNDISHLRDFQEGFSGGVGQGFQAAEVAGDVPGGGLSHEADAYGVEHALKGDAAGGVYAFQETLRGAFLPAFQAHELPRAQVIQVRRRPGQAALIQLVHGGLPAEDVHGLAGDKMLHPAFDLGGAALAVGTEPFGFSLHAHQGRAAVRAGFGEDGRNGPFRPFALLHAGDLGDDFPAFLHIHPVSLVQVQGADLVFVDQGGAPDHGAAQEHGFQIGYGGDGAGAAHLVVYAEDGGAGLFGLEFIRHGPAGALGGVAQQGLEFQLVDFDDNPVRGVGEFLACAVPMADEGFNLLNVPADFPVRRHGKAPLRGGLEGLVMGRELHLAHGDVVEHAEKAPAGYFPAVLQFEGAAGGVAGVGKGLFLIDLPFPVQALKGLIGHEDFSADLEFFRPAAAFEFMRDVGYLTRIGGDVVPLDPVSAGEGPVQPAVAVGEADGGAVVLEFAAVGEGAVQRLGHPVREFFHFFNGIGVAQRQHGILVRVLGKALGGTGLQVRPYLAGGGVGRGKLRELRFQALQFVHELVVLIVAHGGRILHIVLPAVLPENSLQLFHAFLCL